MFARSQVSVFVHYGPEPDVHYQEVRNTGRSRHKNLYTANPGDAIPRYVVVVYGGIQSGAGGASHLRYSYIIDTL